MEPVRIFTDENYVTESYLRRKIEVNNLSHLIADIFGDLAYNGAWFNHPNDDDWLEHGKISCIIDGHGYRMEDKIDILIKDRFYQPGGKVLRSDPKDLDEGVVTTGEYSSIRNHGDEPIEHEVDKTVSLMQSQESKLSAGITMDLTSKTSAGYAGVTEDLEVHLGVTVNKEESQSSSKTVTTSFNDKVTIDAGEEVAIVYKKTDKRYSQDYSINALIDIDFEVYLHDHHGGPKGDKAWHLYSDKNHAAFDGHDRLSFKSLHEFLGFLAGYDTRAPAMEGYKARMNDRAKRAFDAIENNTHGILSLVLTGTDYIVHDDDADYSVMDISNMSDEDVKDQFGKEGNALGG